MAEITVGSIKNGNLAVVVITRDPGSRVKPRIQLDVWGARYPYSLDCDEALELANALTAAAQLLSETLVITRRAGSKGTAKTGA